MLKPSQIVLLVLTGVLTVLVGLAITSLLLQIMANESYKLTQQLIPALNAAGYDYWLDWGTLLGAARDKTMIQHDWDADIGMPESEFKRLQASWPNDPRFKFMKLIHHKEGLYKVRQGLGWVDIFRYSDSHPTTMQMLSLPSYKQPCRCTVQPHSIERTTVYPLVTLPFGQVIAKVPAKTTEYLEHCYGANWRIPRLEGKSKLVVLLPMRPRKRPTQTSSPNARPVARLSSHGTSALTL